VTGVGHHTQLLVELGVSLTFSLDWPSNKVLLISTLQVARIKSVSHHVWLMKRFNDMQYFTLHVWRKK
jgi:hypothetical protein